MDKDDKDNLKSSSIDDNKEDINGKVSSDASIDVPSDNEEEIIIIEEDDDSITSEDFSMEDFEKKSEVSKKADERQKKKIDSRKETIKDIEEFEKLLEIKRQKKLKAREARRAYNKENNINFLNKEYLKDFPIGFKQLVVILLGVLVLAVSLSVAFLPTLRVENYVIEGNHQVSNEEIIELIGINEGSHMLRSYYGIENRIKSINPYIKEIRITPRYPSTLVVTVVERQKIAYIATADGYAAIDKDGIVLEFSSDYTEEVHPILCGIEINSVVIGHDIGITDNLSYQKMIVILGSVLSAEQNSIYNSDYSFFDNLQEVRILPSGVIFLTVKLPNDSLLTVKLNDITTIDDKMHWLMYAIEEGGMNDLPAGSLDMTDESPIFHRYDIQN